MRVCGGAGAKCVWSLPRPGYPPRCVRAAQEVPTSKVGRRAHNVVIIITMLVTILVIAGAWDDAPTGWRILPATSYSNDYSWFVRELEVYASPDCTGAPIPPFQTFGTNSVDTGKIVDGDPETAWSSMTYGKTFDAREHYVGFTVRKANAVQGNCVKLNQGSLHGGGSGIAKEIMLRIPRRLNRLT